MSQQFMIILTTLILLVLILFIFYPKHGVAFHWKKLRLNSKRVKIEDALKHLYNCEYNGMTCTINSLAGNLSIKTNAAAELIKKLEKMNLLTVSGEALVLTPEGRNYALRIIRVHRLWERYLADETGLAELEWHDQAEITEHLISPKEADALAAQIGNPLFDPHGDPIPSADGLIPSKKGIPITDLKTNDIGKIVHIEDEPLTIYSQLIALGLYVGEQVRVVEKEKEKFVFEANGELCVLAPSFANNITVTHIPDQKLIKIPFRKLSDLKIGEVGTVIGLSKALRGQQRRRILDLGVVPGTEISAELESPGGDPTGYKIRGATIALRKDQANKIFIQNEYEKGKAA